jgi:hypothetical protein
MYINIQEAVPNELHTRIHAVSWILYVCINSLCIYTHMYICVYIIHTFTHALWGNQNISGPAPVPVSVRQYAAPRADNVYIGHVRVQLVHVFRTPASHTYSSGSLNIAVRVNGLVPGLCTWTEKTKVCIHGACETANLSIQL